MTDPEMEVLAAVTDGHPDTMRLVTLLEADDFSHPRRRELWTTCLTVLERDGTVEPNVLLRELAGVGEMLSYLGRLPILDPVRAAEQVAAQAHRRRAQRLAADLATRLEATDVDVDATVEAAVSALTAHPRGSAVVQAADDTVWKDVLELVAGGAQRGVSTGLVGLDSLYRIVPGAVTVVTGTPGTGKTEFVDAIVTNLALNVGWRFALYSPEQAPVAEHIIELAHRRLGFRPAGGMVEGMDLEKLGEWMDRHLWWIDPDVETSVQGILSQARWLARRHEVCGLVIDPWNKTTWQREQGESTTEAIGRLLAEVVRFARTEKVHVWIVAHPTKLPRDAQGVVAVPTAYDISQSAEWYNQADVVVALWRDQHGRGGDARVVEVHVQKVRRRGVYGETGMRRLVFNPDTKGFERFGADSPV